MFILAKQAMFLITSILKNVVKFVLTLWTLWTLWTL